MKILLLEPFYTGSHKSWADGFKAHSQHHVEIFSLEGYHWKWRMHGAAITLASRFLESSFTPDLILASDMLDVSTFLSLSRKKVGNIPITVYFHENQITYPWSPNDQDKPLKRDVHYGFINYTSALVADAVFFNSKFHRSSFLNELPDFLKQFPDYKNLESVKKIEEKSQTLLLGLDLKKFDTYHNTELEKQNPALILWNHRWEFDKYPTPFFESLFTLSDRGIDFKLAVLGESFTNSPSIFKEAKERLKDHIVHFGFCSDFSEYAKWLWRADILPVTSGQDFFGGSIVEAMYCNTIPLLPKRLAYPEHIPEAYHSAFFYDEADFLSKLQKRIMDVRILRVQNTQQFVARYDWAMQIKMYDVLFNSFVEKKF